MATKQQTTESQITESQIQAFARVMRRLGVLFARIAGQQSSAHETLSKPEMLTLDVLGVRGPCSMGEIAEHLGVVRSAVTPLVDRLEGGGLVERVRWQEDRRVWHVALTDRGRAAYAELEAVYRAVAAELLAPLDAAERDTLIALMERVGAAVPEA